MKTAMIADLKARLSSYLAQVRQGHVLTIVNRDTPIAQIVPYSQHPPPLRVREPITGALPLRSVPLPRRLRTDTDIVDLLLEERQIQR